LIWLRQDKHAMPSVRDGMEKAWMVLKNICRNMPDGVIKMNMWRARGMSVGSAKLSCYYPDLQHSGRHLFIV
jgi:hypothetical protein